MGKFIAEGAKVLGDVTLGDGCTVWFNAVIRGDVSPIIIGDGSNVQDCCVLHTEEGTPLVLGKGVTVGHGAILHSCSVGDNTIIGMGAVVLNRAKIGKNCIIGAGAVVTQDAVVPDGSLFVGVPAKFKRQLTAEEVKSNEQNAAFYVKFSKN